MNHSELIERVKEQLDELDQKIDTLNERARQTRSNSRAELENLNNVIREKRRRLVDQLGELKQASQDEAASLQHNAEATWRALQQSVRYFNATLDQRLNR